MRLDSIPRVKLTSLPTPLDEAPRLANNLGLRKMFIKRDDCTTLGMGGNKVRKLEYLMADAIEQKANVILTDGGPQSNHARLTAAAACKLGFERCILFLGGPSFDRFDGILLLDIVLGAEIRFLQDATVKQMEDAMRAEADKLQSEGWKPYVIPIGGSTPLGDLGYVQCMRELAEQLGPEEKNPLVFTAVGSAGTLAGCALGLKLFLPEAELIGISVAGRSKTMRESAAQNANESAELIGVNKVFTPEDIRVEEGYYGKMYGVPSEAGNNAVLLAAQTEAIILDPIYTGKAMSGLVDMAKRKLIDTNRTVVFIHTGGSPGLMAFEEQFRASAKFEKVS